MEMFLTVEQTALRLQLSPLTVRRQLARGALRGVKRGRVWRVPESALGEATPRVSEWAQAAQASAPIYAESLASGGHLTAITGAAEPMAARLWARLTNPQTHNAAILEIAQAPASVRAIINAKSGAAAAAFYATPEGAAELADWRALDGEPFQDDAGDYYSEAEEAAFRAERGAEGKSR
jgi:excisionase family DNA binding protein